MINTLCAENNEGNTPLMIAEEKNFDDCIELVSFREGTGGGRGREGEREGERERERERERKREGGGGGRE